MPRLLLAVAFLACLALPARAQEIVVTASKRLSDYDSASTPHVVLVHRADNLITEVKVVCDTRDESQRRAELKETLRNLIKAAAASGGTIELGLGDDIVGRFDASMLDAVIEPERKADTSSATLVIKTRVTATDSFDSAALRIAQFIARAPKAGRTEVLRDKDWNLTLIRPEQYRDQIVALVADDARKTAAAFGEGYGATVEGLQLPVSWYRATPLELALYIPYRLGVGRD